MGYESRIYVVNVCKTESLITGENIFTYADIVAVVNMSKMSSEFHKLFLDKIDYTIFAEDGDKDTNKDRYGDIIKSADIQDVIEWLESEIERDDYRRLKPLLGLLKGFNREEWENLKVLHYGY